MKVFYLLIYLMCIATFAQNRVLSANYEIYYDTHSPHKKFGHLYYDTKSNESVFIEDLEKHPWNLATQTELMTMTLEKKMNARYIVYKHLSSSLVMFEDFAKTIYQVQEYYPNYQWNITKEEKIIGDILCQKAEGYYRGTLFEAWYSKEIPISSGPWKFHGLPGLVVEVQSENKKYKYVLTSIKWENEISKQLPIAEKVIEKQAFEKLKKEFIIETAQKSAPRGSTVSTIKNSREGFLESIYEWEEATK